MLWMHCAESAYAYLILLGVLLIVCVLFIPDGLASIRWRKLFGRMSSRSKEAA